MSLQPSASRTDLLLACPRPFDSELEADPDVPGVGARYGSAFHKILAACLRTGNRGSQKALLETSDRYSKEVDRAAREFDMRRAASELAGHVKSSAKVLRNWLTREKLEVVDVEEAYAVEPRSGGSWRARAIPPHDDEHHYTVNPGEIPGTVDLTARSRNRKRGVVVDHKTGWEDEGFARPSTIPQMRTLGLATPTPTLHTEVGIFHADRQGLPAIYVEPYEIDEQRAHADELHRALSLIGSGFLRPGPQCRYCPLRGTCPAQKAEIISESTNAVVSSAVALAVEPLQGLLAPDTGKSIEEKAGALYDLLKKLRQLDEAGREEIKRLVKAGAVIETREGGSLVLKKQIYEVLSKKSVLEALGAVEGQRLLSRLRKKGAIREATREMVVPEK